MTQTSPTDLGGWTRRQTPWRVPVLTAIAVTVVGGALLGWGVAKPVAVTPPPVGLADIAAPATAESSSWYCPGGSGIPGGDAVATLYFSNTTTHAISGTVTVITSSAETASTTVTVPAGTESTFVPSSIRQAGWLATSVTFAGGGVVASELVSGPLGWSEAPCSSTTSPRWYFAAGATVNGSTLYVAIMNPLPTTAVIDLQFTTSAGVISPQLFQGLVLGPRTMAVAEVASYVQNQSAVSTTVVARSGQVVASELEERTVGPLAGLSLRLGSPAASATWTFPRSVNVTGGSTAISVFNPGATTENVTVRVYLSSGPIAPFTTKLAPDSTWTLATSQSSRIPPNIDYSTSVVASGGAGVIVDRTAASSQAGSVPQWGIVSGVPIVVSGAHATAWIVPGPSRPVPSPEPGAVPFALGLSNPGGKVEMAKVYRYDNGALIRLPRVAPIRVSGHGFAVVEPSRLTSTGSTPLVVTSTGPLSVMEDFSPAGMPGVVSLAGIPLAGIPLKH